LTETGVRWFRWIPFGDVPPTTNLSGTLPAGGTRGPERAIAVGIAGLLFRSRVLYWHVGRRELYSELNSGGNHVLYFGTKFLFCWSARPGAFFSGPEFYFPLLGSVFKRLAAGFLFWGRWVTTDYRMLSRLQKLRARLHLGLAGTLALGYPTGFCAASLCSFKPVFLVWLALGRRPVCSLSIISPRNRFFTCSPLDKPARLGPWSLIPRWKYLNRSHFWLFGFPKLQQLVDLGSHPFFLFLDSSNGSLGETR